MGDLTVTISADVAAGLMIAKDRVEETHGLRLTAAEFVTACLRSRADAGNPWAPDEWSPVEQVRVFRVGGRELAQTLAAEHGKKVL